MSELSLILPEVNKPDKTEDPKIVTAFTTVQTWANGNIGGVNVEPALTGLRLVDRQGGTVIEGVTEGTYLFTNSSGVLKAGTSSTLPPSMLRLDTTNFGIGGKTSYVYLKGSVATNGIAPAANFQFRLWTVTEVGGAENVFLATLGAIVAETALLKAPAAKSLTEVESAAVAFPAAGQYALTCSIAGTTAAKSVSILNASLFVLNA